MVAYRLFERPPLAVSIEPLTSSTKWQSRLVSASYCLT